MDPPPPGSASEASGMTSRSIQPVAGRLANQKKKELSCRHHYKYASPVLGHFLLCPTTYSTQQELSAWNCRMPSSL